MAIGGDTQHGRHRVRVATIVIDAVHLDLETDDPQAEVTRLTALGASRDHPLGHGAWVLQDPAGNRFCVIYPETPDWPQGTKVVAGPTPAAP